MKFTLKLPKTAMPAEAWTQFGNDWKPDMQITESAKGMRRLQPFFQKHCQSVVAYHLMEYAPGYWSLELQFADADVGNEVRLQYEKIPVFR